MSAITFQPKMEADELKLRVKQLEEELETLRAQRWGEAKSQQV